MAGVAAKKVGQVLASNSALFLCDMQEGFRRTVRYFPEIVEVSSRMLNAAKLMNIPTIVTEQYPKGLGNTASELDVSGLPVFPKTQFSMLLPEVMDQLGKHTEVKSVLLCGIEAQACIQQTVLDLLEKEYDVHVIVDACSSRSLVDRKYAFKRMENAGAYLTTSEAMILQLCKDAKHPQFKSLQKLIATEAPDSGLLGNK